VASQTVLISGSIVHVLEMDNGWTQDPAGRQAVPMPDSPQQLGDAVAELRALMKRLHRNSGLSCDALAERTHLSRSSIGNYLTKPAGRPTENLRLVLDALGASAAERAHALELHRQTVPGGVDPAAVGWLERAWATNCRMWPIADFTPTAAVVHTAIGQRHADPQEHGHAGDFTPPPAADVSRAGAAPARSRSTIAVIGDANRGR